MPRRDHGRDSRDTLIVKSTRPLVLIANDDGIAAEGIQALQRALSDIADTIVCAPETNQSATSHSLSLHRILRLRRVDASRFALDGTPADCIYVALHSGTRILPRRPDLVVSGINQGVNLGIDVIYSGTIAAAREAALRGIPAIAFSADMPANMASAAALGARIAAQVLTEPRGRTALLNVNFPKANHFEIRATRIGARLYEEEVVYRRDPRGQEYLWIGGATARHDHVSGSDTEAYDQDCVSITPLTLDLFAEKDAGIATRIADAMNHR